MRNWHAEERELDSEADGARRKIVGESEALLEQLRDHLGLSEPDPPRRRWTMLERGGNPAPRRVAASINAEDAALTALAYARKGAVPTAAAWLAVALAWSALSDMTDLAWEAGVSSLEEHRQGKAARGPLATALADGRAQVERLHPFLRGYMDRAGCPGLPVQVRGVPA